VWSVNVEDRYHEVRDDAEAGGEAATNGERGTGRDAPVLPRSAIDAAAQQRRGEGT
jgi:hypothetical protein